MQPKPPHHRTPRLHPRRAPGPQDLTLYSLKGLSAWAQAARAAGIEDQEIDSFINGERPHAAETHD